MPDVQLLIALRFYASGPQHVNVADFASVSISSVCPILRRVSSAFAEMCGQFVEMPRTPKFFAILRDTSP